MGNPPILTRAAGDHAPEVATGCRFDLPDALVDAGLAKACNRSSQAECGSQPR